MNTKIDGLVVCENYSDYFSQCVAGWKKVLRSMLVVTSNRDKETESLCMSHGLDVFKTDVFWDRGAKFNKGAAIAEAYESKEWSDWVLFFDADMNPPEDLSASLEDLSPGTLYGVNRILESGEKIIETEIAGAFMLFHSEDKNAKRKPIVDVSWYHCGNYDSKFQGQWDADKKIKLNVDVLHLGTPFENWCGRGNKPEMDRLWRRRRQYQGFMHERIK